MTQQVRSHVSKQIDAEMTRQGIGLPELARASEISLGVIDEYIAATREIKFQELRPIFEALGQDLIQALSAKPVTAHISWRKTLAHDRPVVVGLTKAFLRIEDLLPKPKLPHLGVKLDDSANDPGMLLSEVQQAAEAARNVLGHHRVEDAYRQWGIPLIGLRLGRDTLDGICLSASSGKTLVIVNVDQPLTRLRFTLLHELWHVLFDQKKDIPPDHLGLDFYRDAIPRDAIPEYRANKWAQLWLVPWDVASKAYDSFQRDSDLEWAQQVLRESGTSTFVLANAIFDVARFKQTKLTYASIRDGLLQDKGLQGDFGSLESRRLVDEATQSIKSIVDEHEIEFGSAVMENLKTVLQLKRRMLTDAL